MKVLLINVVCGVGSTGRICTDLAKELSKRGNEVTIAYGRGEYNQPSDFSVKKIDSSLDIIFHGIKARLSDGAGFGSKKATREFIKWIKSYKPDIIHLHNIHGYYIDIVQLFEFLKGYRGKIIWTLHDAWAVTGHCSVFTSINCRKWINGCNKCPQKGEYPKSYTDRAYRNYHIKKEVFCYPSKMVIITPSEWLRNIINRSFLNKYKSFVINNGIDTTVFYPRNDNIYKRMNLSSKKIILGVAYVWSKLKGFDDFIQLAGMLNDDYRIVLIGVNKKQLQRLPSNIIGIEKTENVDILAMYYSGAHVYVNLTYEDNYPTTNLEAICCGTPVITYDTGGSGESAKHFGKVLEKGDVQGIYNSLSESFAYDSRLNMDISYMVQEYMNIYE